MSRWVALVLAVVLAVVLAGCGALSRNRQRAPAADMPDESKAGAQRARGRAPDGSGIYVASLPILGVEDSVVPQLGGLSAQVAFVAADLNLYPRGAFNRLGVLNRWNGAAGKHTEETRLLDREGRTVASAAQELTGTQTDPLIDPDLAQVVLDVLDIGALQAGYYDVVVMLDGREYARYGIRIIAVDGQSGGGSDKRAQ